MEDKKEMVLSMCTCKGCPTYVDCQENIGFCLETIGKSKCITAEKGCICPTCPVTPRMGLKHSYYSTRGSEMEQIKKGTE